MLGQIEFINLPYAMLSLQTQFLSIACFVRLETGFVYVFQSLFWVKCVI